MRKRSLFMSFCLVGMLLFGACSGQTNETSTPEESSRLEETNTESISTSESISEGTEESLSEESSSEESLSEESSSEESLEESSEDSTETSETEAETDLEMTTGPVFEEANYIAYASENVNLRLSPEIPPSNVNIYTTIPKYTVFTVTGYTQDWCQVLYEGSTYYITSEYVVAGEVPQPTSQTFEDGTTLTIPTDNYNGIIVAVDAGHQQYGISETEPNAPGSSVMKAKLTTGTQGVSTGIPEYELNLQVSLKLKQNLLDRGYGVYMIRENNDCPMSNAERAVAANNSGANIFIRVHANSLNDSSVTGCLSMTPSAANAYVGYMASECATLSTLVTNAICAATGAVNKGIMETDTMTGINWCSIPVTIVEMGFMSNPTEDQLMAQDYYRQLIANGIADGVDAYFGK
ncbi:MAG: N-acetylmuramoyl-L-alanine amidase [Lachnospiraceae bacterium]